MGMAGVNDDFDLQLVFPNVMKKLFVCELLKEFEIWECSKDLIKVSSDIRATIKEKIKQTKDETSSVEIVDKIDDETKEEKKDDDNDDADEKENAMKMEPI